MVCAKFHLNSTPKKSPAGALRREKIEQLFTCKRQLFPLKRKAAVKEFRTYFAMFPSAVIKYHWELKP
jgi:hypothetical protein